MLRKILSVLLLTCFFSAVVFAADEPPDVPAAESVEKSENSAEPEENVAPSEESDKSAEESEKPTEESDKPKLSAKEQKAADKKAAKEQKAAEKKAAKEKKAAEKKAAKEKKAADKESENVDESMDKSEKAHQKAIEKKRKENEKAEAKEEKRLAAQKKEEERQQSEAKKRELEMMSPKERKEYKRATKEMKAAEKKRIRDEKQAKKEQKREEKKAAKFEEKKRRHSAWLLARRNRKKKWYMKEDKVIYGEHSGSADLSFNFMPLAENGIGDERVFRSANLFAQNEISGVIYDFSYKIATNIYANFIGLDNDKEPEFTHYDTACFDFMWDGSKIVSFNLVEAWAQYRAGPVDLSVGIRRLRWGSGKFLSVLDKLNAKHIDTRYLWGIDDVYIGSPMLFSHVDFPKYIGYMEAIFMPVTSADRKVPVSYENYRESDKTLPYYIDEPVFSPHNFEGGLYFKFHAKEVNIGFGVLTILDRGVSDRIGLRNVDAVQEEFDIVFGHGRRYIAGLDLSWERPYVALNGEAAFVMTNDMASPTKEIEEDIQVFPDSSSIEACLEASWILPSETHPLSLTFMAQPKYFLNTKVIDYVHPSAFALIVGGRFKGEFVNTRLIKGLIRPEVQFLMSTGYSDFEARLSLGVRIRTNFEARLGAILYGSTKESGSITRFAGPFFREGGSGMFDNATNIFLKFHIDF